MNELEDRVKSVEDKINRHEAKLKIQRINELLMAISLCFICVLLTAFILTYTGLIDLKIISEIEINIYLEHTLNFLMFMVNMFFIFSLSLKLYSRTIFLVLTGYIPFYVLEGFSIYRKTLLFSAIVPAIYVIIVAFILYGKDFWKTALRFLAFTFIIGLYQQFSGYIKLTNFTFTLYKCNILVSLIYSIDLYLFYIITYWVVKTYVGRRIVEIPVRLFRLLKKTCKEILKSGEPEDVSDMTKRQQHIFLALIWVYLIMQSFFVIGLDLLINRFFHYLGGMYIGLVELIIHFIVLELCRRVLGRTFHSKKPVICTAISLLVFFTLSRFSIPLNISLFYNIGVSAAMAVIIHIIILKYDDYYILKAYKIEREEFKAKTRRGRAAIVLETLSPEHPEYKLLTDYVNGETLEILADKYNLSQSTLNRKINALTRN